MFTNKSKIMRYSSSVLIVALFGFLVFKMTKPEIVYSEKESLILQSIIGAVQAGHFAPKEIDNDFSKAVFKSYMEKTDGSKRFFTLSEYKELKKSELLLDDQVNNRSFEFFDASIPVIENAIDRATKIFEEIMAKPFNFEMDGEFETEPDKLKFASNEEELKLVWKKILTYQVMNKWTSLVRAQEKKENKEENKTEDELIEDAIKDVQKNMTNLLKRFKELRRSDRLEYYFSSVTNYFDPHTDYFSPKEKQDFDINMGGQLEGIGARLQQDGEFTKVSSLVVGGPAWKTKKMEDGDIIMKVAQKGQEAVDIAGMRIDDVVQLVRGKKGTVVVLTLKKKDNSITELEIEREKVQIEEGKGKSVMVTIPGTIQNIGYINLPKFYSSFDNEGGNSCAYDVLQEIKKLKAEDVNGIILDLRNNSGGSLNDVVDMSGFFIEQGPIVQVNDRYGKPLLHNDKDKEVHYDGPLVIMVNQFSASASEIIAAALQDYERAIIVGTPTFGKGTVQRFFDLDRGIRGYEEMKPLGNVKMTVQKFYRVNGGSTQLIGVTPDIILPDAYSLIETGEKEYDNALAWSEIAPVSYKQNVVKLEKKPDLIRKSNDRVAQSKNFQLVMENAQKIKESKNQTSSPLKLNSYRAMVDQRENDFKKFDVLFKDEIPYLHIENLQADLQKINSDESSKGRNEEFIKDLKKDFYLEETMYILRDMIKLEKSFAQQEKKIATAN